MTYYYTLADGTRVPAPTGPAAPAPVSRRLDSIEPEPITWLWDRRIPAREVTLIAGEGGLGKTSLVTDIAARLSVGRRLPGDDAYREPMTIGFMSLEDDPGRVVRPRFELAAGDPTRFHVFDGFRTRTGTRVAELPADTEGIGGWCQAIGAGLLVIDSWTAYATALDHHKGAEVRRVLGPLSELCHTAKLTVLLIGHVSKSPAVRGAARISGSADIVNAARSVYLVGRAPGEDPELRVLCPAKMNYCKPARALTFALEDCGQVARVDWRGEIDLHADDLEPAHAPREGGSARESNLTERVVSELGRAGEAGLTRTDLSNALGRNYSADRLGAVLVALAEAGLVTSETEPTAGRPKIRYRLSANTKNEENERTKEAPPSNGQTDLSSFIRPSSFFVGDVQ